MSFSIKNTFTPHSMNFTKIYSHDDYDFWRKSFVKSTEQVLSKLHFSLFSRDILQMRVKFSVYHTVYYVILNNHTWYLRISDLKGSDTYARLNTSVTLRCFITLDIQFIFLVLSYFFCHLRQFYNVYVTQYFQTSQC